MREKEKEKRIWREK